MSQCHDKYDLKRYRYSPPADVTVEQCHDEYPASELDQSEQEGERIVTAGEELPGTRPEAEGDGRIQAVMSGDVVSSDEGTSLYELAQMMIDDEVGSVVITAAGQVTGIVTERDIVFAVAEGMDMSEAEAVDVMSADPLCVDVGDRIEVTVERMVEAGVLHVPVLDGSRLCGIVSARDLMARIHAPG